MTSIVPSWTKEQQTRLVELLEDPASWVGYWCSDQWGRAANGGRCESVSAGLVQLHQGPTLLCMSGFHATRTPHWWAGSRVWVVALRDYTVDAIGQKAVGGVREIVGELLPEDVIDPQVAARLGLKNLAGADLSYAVLRGANLVSANLAYANLSHANLTNAFLAHGGLAYTNFTGTVLTNANLAGAVLIGANFAYASLIGVSFFRAILCGANFDGANITGANFDGANLIGADFTNVVGGNDLEALITRTQRKATK